MTNFPFTTLVALACLGSVVNVIDQSSILHAAPVNQARECGTAESSLPDSNWTIEWGSDFVQGLPGCLDCVQYAQFEEAYCQSRGTDCDGLFGIDESYRWERLKKLYECQDGEESNLYVDCTYWDEDNCCNNGSTGVPPTDCSHNGTINCAARIVIGG